MRGWLGLVVAAAIAGAPLDASAQTVEVAPTGGYRLGGGFFERVTGQPVDLDGAPAVGAVVNVFLWDGLWVEGFFTHQRARVDVAGDGGQPSSRWTIDVDHWLAGGLQEFGRGQAQPFLTGLIGLTRYAAAGDNEIRFVVSAGGGVKLRPTPRFGVRLDGRAFTTFADVDGRAVACGPGLCLFAVDADVVWQAEFSASVVVAF